MYQHDFSNLHARLADIDASEMAEKANENSNLQKIAQAKEEGIFPSFTLVKIDSRKWLAITKSQPWSKEIRNIVNNDNVRSVRKIYDNILCLNTSAYTEEYLIREAIDFAYLPF